MRRPVKRHLSHAWKTWGTPVVGGDFDDFHDGRCAWCGTDRATRLVLDHCHMTGLVRGILCNHCNIVEGKSYDPIWDSWREGDHPAAALRCAQIYSGWGGTTYSSQSALFYYSGAERAEYWRSLPKLIEDNPDMPWPTEAPWTDEILARQEASRESVRAALSGVFTRPEPRS